MYITVTEFSKKTGDYPSLSATDIKVMALAYQLEKEKVGTDHLKKEPQFNRLVTFRHHLPIESKDTTGFYSPGSVVCIEMLIDIVHLRLDCAPLGLLSVCHQYTFCIFSKPKDVSPFYIHIFSLLRKLLISHFFVCFFPFNALYPDIVSLRCCKCFPFLCKP
jgi:hypothetical protein